MTVSATMLRAMDHHDLWPEPSAGAVIACSAGLDSTVLARLLAPELLSRGHRCSLACLDHGLRDDAPDDGAFVEALAAELGVEVARARRSPPQELVRREGLQSAARAARRGWLTEIADELGGPIFCAHHQDDQLETVLLRRREGVPRERAAAMRPRAGRFHRPLLDVGRGELRALALREGWAWREDPSNSELRYERNRIRHVHLPALRASEPGSSARLLREGLQAAARGTYLLQEAEAAAARVVVESGPNRWTGSRSELVNLDKEVALVLLRSSIDVDGRGPGRRALGALLDDAASPGPARLRHLGGGWTARTVGDQIELTLGPLELEGTEPPAQQLPRTGAVLWNGRTIGCRPVDRAEATRTLMQPGAGRAFALVDPARTGSLRVEAAGQGRRLRPFGLAGSRKIRDVLAEAGVARPQRAGWPVVVADDGEPLWLVGLRASRRATLGAASDAALLLYTSADRLDDGRIEAG